MAVASGVGSMPGEDFAESVRMVLGELPDLPYLPELPARGPIASMTGRTLAMVSELGFDLQPAGWRLTDSPGLDHRRARSLLAQDLDTLEELTQGYAGPLKLQLSGPWTLAATVERPRGDRLLADVGARRELAEALALGVTDHVADVRRRVPGASLVVQVDEPLLPAVLGGGVPTASGFNRHRSVRPAQAAAALGLAFEAITSAGATSVAHCCAAEVPFDVFTEAAPDGVSLDVSLLPASGYDPLGALLDAGHRVYLGVVPSTDQEPVPALRTVIDRVLRLLDMIGFDPGEVSGNLVLTPACGLAGASPAYARSVLAVLQNAVVRLTTTDGSS